MLDFMVVALIDGHTAPTRVRDDVSQAVVAVRHLAIMVSEIEAALYVRRSARKLPFGSWASARHASLPVLTRPVLI